MTHHRQFVPDEERAHGVGATGGLPGANADPKASLVNDDELASTVGRGDVSDGMQDVEREVEVTDPTDPDVSGHMGDGYLEGARDNADHMVDGRLADGRPAPGPQGSGPDAAGGSEDS